MFEFLGLLFKSAIQPDPPPPPPSPSLAQIIVEEATAQNFEPELIAAIIVQESGGDQYAELDEPRWLERMEKWDAKKMREHGFFVKVGPPGLAQERRMRARSYGYMQILGITAREHGFKARYLSALYNPRANIKMGCKVLASKRKAAERKLGNVSHQALINQTLLFYNGGGDPLYHKRVLNHIKSGAAKALL